MDRRFLRPVGRIVAAAPRLSGQQAGKVYRYDLNLPFEHPEIRSPPARSFKV
jgi:hypothetical protein